MKWIGLLCLLALCGCNENTISSPGDKHSQYWGCYINGKFYRARVTPDGYITCPKEEEMP